MKTHCKQCDHGGPVNDKGLCLQCAVKTNAERRRHPPQAEPQEPLTPKRDCRNCALQFVDSHRCDTCHKQNGYQNWVARGIGKQEGTKA